MTNPATARRRLLVLATLAASGTTILISHGTTRFWIDRLGVFDSSSFRLRRNLLRFVDPDHRTCGESDEQHAFAVHCLYGGMPDDWYDRKTITTDVDWKHDKKKNILLALQALSHVARKHDRAIRPPMPIKPGYNNEDKQVYAIVDASAMGRVGVTLAEPGYWSRAMHHQGIPAGPRKRELELGDDPLSGLRSLAEGPKIDDAEEIVLKMKELMKIDPDDLGSLVGKEGGYANGTWVESFTCSGVHDNPQVLPIFNDPPYIMA